MQNVIEMALKSMLFVAKLKNHLAAGVSAPQDAQAPVCHALELHQLAQNTIFVHKKLTFASSLLALNKILVVLLVAFTAAD